ncbi:MAG: CpsD/CapB family tyrosine-protein kinase [Balneolaceae bacterium]
MEEPKRNVKISKRKNGVSGNNKTTPSIYKPVFVGDSALVQTTVSKQQLEYVDPNIIREKFYNNFNFSKLASRNTNPKLALGVTSANKGEGKTLVAANMAVSLARAYRQRTVLVDLNFKNPELHKVFGGRLKPGMVEAMQHHKLCLNPTKIKDLYLLTAGNIHSYTPGIQDTIALREILFTLKNEFDFIIVDMSSIFPIEDFPIHFVNEVDGLLTVIDTKNTKKKDLERIYKQIDERRFLGYILNRFNDER